MSIFSDDHRLIIIYLSSRGCREYTMKMIELLRWRQPIIITSRENEALFKKSFPNLSVSSISVPRSKMGLLLKSCAIKKKVSQIINPKTTPFQLYFPAFHPWNLSLLKWSNKKDWKSLLTIHDYRTHVGERSRLVEWLQKRMIKVADKVICLTEYVQNQIQKDFSASSKFHVVPHPILDAGVVNNLKHSAKPKLLFIGRGVHYKGIDLLLKATKNLEIERLTIAGKMRDTFILDSNLKVIDRDLSEDQMSELLGTHNILIIPYREASQSGILTLGISAEIAMVITNAGGLTEQLSDDSAIWCEPTVKSIREAIQRLMSSPEVYNSIKANIRKSKQELLTLKQL